MFLLTSEEIDRLRIDLENQAGFRISSISVGFSAFDFARTGESLVDRAVAYSMPNGDRLVGLGTAWRASSSGEGRFDEITERLTALGHNELRVFFGFSFLPDGAGTDVWDGYPPAEVFLPRIGIEETGGGTTLTVIVPEGDRISPTLDLLASMRHPEPIEIVETGDHVIESHPPVSEWADLVESAVSAIRSGELEKVVLARSVVVRSTEPVAILRVFRELVTQYPQCYNFAWKSGDSVFMGASPELIAEVRGDRLTSNPLAGSAPRGEGDLRDRLLADELMESTKNRREHSLVVDDLVERLSLLTSELTASPTPSLKQMATVQHLSTEITGSLIKGAGILDVVSAVHPTPAVGGVDRERAVGYINDVEGIDRGWYTGGVGWINGSGEGAVCIALRCGLIRGDTTHLYAGAGIVAESQPDAELKETRLKFKPLLSVLTRN